jgi:hypothetical protein
MTREVVLTNFDDNAFSVMSDGLRILPTQPETILAGIFGRMSRFEIKKEKMD